MKNSIKVSLLVFLLMILLSKSSYAQYGWLQQSSPITDPLGGVCFLDENTGFAIDQWYGKILKTTNGGTIWSVDFTYPCGLHKLCFLNKDTGTIIGASGTILLTTDGGNNWILKSNGSSNLNKIRFVKTNASFSPTGFIVGVNGILLKTTNSGYSWSSLNSTTNQHLYGVYFANLNTGYIVGQGKVLKTQNGGSNWTDVSPGINRTFMGVCFSNPDTGVVVGGDGYFNDGIILRTINGGNNWQTVLTLSNQSALQGVRNLGNNIMTAIGNSGMIVRTLDAGATWFIQGSPASLLMADVYFINKNTGWVVGHGGTILKTTTGGFMTNISNYSNNIPDEYELHQNFPNPFNPSTTIRFDIPKSSYTKIIVYNNLGRIVSKLVNEKLNAGSYEVNWDPKSVSSGIYFYRLDTEEFFDVKKMLLIK